jgi:hypothetical protein
MKSWYKLAQSKRREYQFDMKNNIYYKILEKEEPFQENDPIRVYHAFRSMDDAIIAAQHGISGQDPAQRVYSYEANNNPKGLFVTTNFNTAKDFTTWGAIMEFDCKFSELEIPVWPGGGYTVQGGMSEYWDWDKLDKQRQQAILQQREKSKQSEYPAIANSSRPELAEMLMSPGEYQALFVGHLNPNRISKFWIQQRDGQPKINDPWISMSPEEFLKQNQYGGKSGSEDRHRDIKGRVFAPEDEFDPTTFVQNLAQHSGQSVESLMETINMWDTEEKVNILSEYIWPKQKDGLIQWIQTNSNSYYT